MEDEQPKPENEPSKRVWIDEAWKIMDTDEIRRFRQTYRDLLEKQDERRLLDWLQAHAGPEAALPPPVITRRPKPKPKPEPEPPKPEPPKEPPKEPPAPPSTPGSAKNGYTPGEGLPVGQAHLGVRLIAPGPIRRP
jgi:hypothetical protein